MIIITAGMMSKMPVATCQVKASLNTRQPMITAVSGSSAPITAVMVLPMRFTATTSEMLVITVQITARKARLRS